MMLKLLEMQSKLIWLIGKMNENFCIGLAYEKVNCKLLAKRKWNIVNKNWFLNEHYHAILKIPFEKQTFPRIFLQNLFRNL